MEKNEVLDAVREIKATISDLDDAVFGNERQGKEGLIKDMKIVHAFILKWEKREYAMRVGMMIVSSNLLLTVLSLIFTFLVGR